MRVAFEIDGMKFAAEADFNSTLSGDNREAINTGAFVRLCNEAKTIALRYIDAKLGKQEKEETRNDAK